MLKTFIERPVLSTVISIIIVVLGIIGMNMLPIEQYPDIAPPTVQIEASYSGASADVIMNSVIVPLEEAINGVEGMTYMTSSAETGSASITVYFKQGVNPDMATVNVQNLVNQATPLLPSEVTQTGVTVRKQQTSNILMISFTSENPDYDAKFLQNYANINVIPQIKRVYGVGNAAVYGANDYSMRVWLKPDVMASYKISTNEVISALRDQNIEAAPGQLGENSNQAFQYTLKYTGRLSSVEEFEDIIIRSSEGKIVRLSDVANVELGSLQYNVATITDGNPSIMMAINQTAGSNATQVIKDVKAELDKAESDLPPGLKFTYLMDVSDFLNASISKVITTLLEAFLLVFIVVFVFLQDWKSTLIPAIAVPVAIVGTFFFLWILGFSINLLTLSALVLAIGIVVDDAIVVVEAVHAELESGAKDPKQAAIKAMGEIAPAIISITLVMASVFIPVSFIGGTSGIFYKQFGLTMAVAIFISAINALTLSPALCALFLKPHDENHGKKSFLKRFYYFFNIGFGAATSKYKKSLIFLGKKGHRWITVSIIAVSSIILFGLMKMIPTGFVPQEDSGAVMGMITLPPGSSMERTDSVVYAVAELANEIPEVKNVGSISGISFMSGMGSSYGSLIIKMDHWDDRKITANEVAAIMTEKTKSINNATFMFFGTPTIMGFGLSNGVSVNLQDRTGGDIYKFYDVTNDFLAKMNQREEVMMAMTTFNPNFPQKQLEANMPKIKDAGITLSDVMGSLQAYIGSQYISNFNLYGKQFRVMVQAAPEYRSKLEDMDGLFVKTASGEMAPVTEFITVTDVTGPETRTRFNLYSSMELTIIPNYQGGFSSGDVIKAIEEIKDEALPSGYSYEFSGMTREESESSSQTVLIFGLCLIFVYLLLCALYESYILPLAVIFSLPVGLAGVFIFLSAFGLSQGITNNIYVQISLIMLIGLLAKNAILIVEYAIQRRQQGMNIVDAAVNGAVARFRPILMTSFAFIFGLLPLAISTGAGAIGNRSMGLSAVGGMFIGTMIGVLVIPSLYIIFQSIQDKFSKSGMINSNDEFINKQNEK
ncbi:efflux RND transporter permease subunit [Prevotella sp. 10(H)]|uniref:efflux RND transporter permease subunit n=1 Tax=Prevotella sp. 10(H) TaxID=1158294 RepID=UPI0004A6C61E|nr:efflux RND transporter permease subunit [Prevotella sp. 10(H)]